MSTLKAGDLALIVGFTTKDINVGKSVCLIQRLMPNEQFTGPDGAPYVASADSVGWTVYGGGFVDAHDGSDWGCVAERHLMPLRGDFQPERQKSREVPA